MGDFGFRVVCLVLGVYILILVTKVWLLGLCGWCEFVLGWCWSWFEANCLGRRISCGLARYSFWWRLVVLGALEVLLGCGYGFR